MKTGFAGPMGIRAIPAPGVPMRAITLLAAVGLAVCLPACTTRGTAIDKRMVLPPGARTMALDRQQGFLMAVPIDEPLPALEGMATGPDGRVEVCVEIVIDDEGRVSAARHTPGVDGCHATPDPAYVAAALEAVRRWRYFAAAVCEFPAGQAKTDDCRGEDVVVRAVPIRLTYAFAFERVAGKARVRARHAAD